MDKLKEIEKSMSMVDRDSGLTMLQVCLSATLYFENAHTPKVREAIVECIDDYISQVENHIKYIKDPKSKRWHGYSKTVQKIAGPKEFLKGLIPQQSFDFYYKGGKKKEEASHFSIQCLGQADWRPFLSYFKFTYPFTWFTDKEQSLFDVVGRYCQLLNPISGYGGIGMVLTPNRTLADDYQTFEYQFAKKYPGLDIDNPIVHSIHLQNGIKGVNWITVIGDKYLVNLGGPSIFKQLDQEEFACIQYPTGIAIRAGHIPQLGNRPANDFPEHYMTLNKLVKSIRVKEHGGLHGSGSNRMHKEQFLEWLARFEDKSDR